MSYKRYKSEYKDAYPFRVGMKKAKSVTSYGMKRFGEGIDNGISVLAIIFIKILNKISVYGTIIFGIGTIYNIITMGICFELLHTKSFFLLAGSFAVGVISHILAEMVN